MGAGIRSVPSFDTHVPRSTPLGIPTRDGGPLPALRAPAHHVHGEAGHEEGLSNLQINLALDIVFSCLAIIVGAGGLLAVGSLDQGGPEIFAFGAAVCGALAGLVIIFVVNFIVSLMSAFAMRDGAPEFGFEHEKNVHLGFAFKWMGTIMSILAVVSIIAMSIFSVSSYYVSGKVPAQFHVPFIVAIIWTVGVSFKALMYVHFVKAITPPEKRILLPIALWSVIIVGLLAIAVIGTGTLSVVSLFLKGDFTAISQGYTGLPAGIFLAPGFALVGYAIFMVVYVATAKAVREGRVLPQVTPPMLMTPTYGAGGGIWQPPPGPEGPRPPPPPE